MDRGTGTLVLERGHKGLCPLGVPLRWKLQGTLIGMVAYKHARRPLAKTPNGGEIKA